MSDEYPTVRACRECGRSDRLYRYTPGHMRRRLKTTPCLQPEGDPEWVPTVSAASFGCEACGLIVGSPEALVTDR